MSSYAEVVVLVEGPTEQRFIKQVLGPYMAGRGLFLTAILLDKPGQKGGDVKFSRAVNDIKRHLKQRPDTWVTLLVDYYGIKGDWPGYQNSKQQTDHTHKAEIMNQATVAEIQQLFPEQNQNRRFIPYISMHEIESLYFSDPGCLAEKLDVNPKQIEKILAECGEPEKINDHPETAPSKRLEKLSSRFKKTTTGIAIASAIGIPSMRAGCPLFDKWLTTMELLAKAKDDQA